MSREDCSALTCLDPLQWDAQLRLSPAYDAARSIRLVEGILYGVNIGFTRQEQFTRTRYARNAASTAPPETARLIDAMIAAEVAQGFKCGPFDSPPFYPFWISPLGAVPKPGSAKIRLIHNLSHPFSGDSVNAGIPREEYCMQRFADAIAGIRLFGRGALLLKFDVSAAFKRIPVRPQDRPLLGMRWRGKYYYELVLPFGLRTSGYRWEEYAAALHYFFEHHLGVELVVHYVDDFLLVTPPGAGATARAAGHRTAVEQLCRRLGVPLAEEKTTGPVTEVVFLGIVIDTLRMEYRLSEERVRRLREQLAVLGSGQPLTCDELMSLVGKLEFAALVIPAGVTFLHRIRAQMLRSKHARHGSARGQQQQQQQHRLDAEACLDAQWWLQVFLTPTGNRRSIEESAWLSASSLHIYSDACNSGYGAFYGTHWLQGKWSEALLQFAVVHQRISMPFLELYALTQAAVTWGAHWRGQRIIFHCDAQAAVAAVRLMRSRRDSMSTLLRLLYATAALHGFEFQCQWLEGVTNTVADRLSRGCSSQEVQALLPGADLSPTPCAPLALESEPLLPWPDPVLEELRLQRRRATSVPPL